jgi:hypothetical protein
MKRDNYGLRTHFPRLQHVALVGDSPEDRDKQAAHTRKKVNILQALEEETSELRDELRTFNFFRFSLPRLQGVALKILPELVRGTENTESCPRSQEIDEDEIQQLGSELQIPCISVESSAT